MSELPHVHGAIHDDAGERVAQPSPDQLKVAPSLARTQESHVADTSDTLVAQMLSAPSPVEQRSDVYLRQLECLADVCRQIDTLARVLSKPDIESDLDYWSMPSAELQALLLTCLKQHESDPFLRLTSEQQGYVEAGIRKLVTLRDDLMPLHLLALENPKALLVELLSDGTDMGDSAEDEQLGKIQVSVTPIGIEITLSEEAYELAIGYDSHGMNFSSSKLPPFLRGRLVFIKDTGEEESSETRRHERQHAVFSTFFARSSEAVPPPVGSRDMREHRRYAQQLSRKELEYARDEIIAYESASPMTSHAGFGFGAFPKPVQEILLAAPDAATRAELLACYGGAHDMALADASEMHWLVNRIRHSFQNDSAIGKTESRLTYLMALLPTRGRRWRHLGALCDLKKPDDVDVQYRADRDKLRAVYAEVLPKLLASGRVSQRNLEEMLSRVVNARDPLLNDAFPIGDIDLTLTTLCAVVKSLHDPGKSSRLIPFISGVVTEHAHSLRLTTIIDIGVLLREYTQHADRAVRVAALRALWQLESEGYTEEYTVTNEAQQLLKSAASRESVLRLFEMLPQGVRDLWSEVRPEQIGCLDFLQDGEVLLEFISTPQGKKKESIAAARQQLFDAYKTILRHPELRSGVLMRASFQSSLRDIFDIIPSDVGTETIKLLDSLAVAPTQPQGTQLFKASRSSTSQMTKVPDASISDMPPIRMA